MDLPISNKILHLQTVVFLGQGGVSYLTHHSGKAGMYVFLNGRYENVRRPPESIQGLGLKVQETLKTGEAILVRGAAQIPLPEASWIPAKGEQPLFQDNSVAAVVPAALLLFKKDRATPVTVPLHIPVYGKTPTGPNDVVRFAFSLDLGTALPNAGLSGTYQIYLIGWKNHCRTLSIIHYHRVARRPAGTG